MCTKRTTAAAAAAAAGGSLLEKLPDSIMNEILSKLELETLCSAACVSTTLRCFVSQILASSSSLDLITFSPDAHTLNQIVPKFTKLEKVTLDCLRLDDYSVSKLLGTDIQQLVFFKCSSLSYHVLVDIGLSCPNIRVLTLEFAGCDKPVIFLKNLMQLSGCRYMESLCIKIRGTERDSFVLDAFYLPETVKVLKLQLVCERDVIQFMHNIIGDGRNILDASTNFGISIPYYPSSLGLTLRSLSLVLDIITDGLIIAIANSLPLLAELDLEDRPSIEPFPPNDLTNNGLQSLNYCRHMTALSLVRSRQNHATSFKEINDMGMFVLSEGCKGLESVRLYGFSKVSDAGFTSILNSCQNLKKIEIYNATLLSDLAFHDISKATSSLVEVKLSSCSFITSEAVEELASSSMLEVLDLFGCRSIADSCLNVSLKALASERRLQDGKNLLRMLDLYHCSALSVESLELLKKPFFRGLRWVGVGLTRLTSKGDVGLAEVRKERPWLTLCSDGCEMGCHDGWQFHKFG